MDTTEKQTAGSVTTAMIDEIDEFIEAQCYDFLNGETEEDKQWSELCLESELNDAPSASIPIIKARSSSKAKESFEPLATNKKDKNHNNTKDIREQDSSFLDDITEQTDENKENIPPSQSVVYTPKTLMTNSKKHQTATKNPSVLMPIKQSQSSQAKCITDKTIIKRDTNVKNITRTSNLVQENQAIKRQKLNEGKSRQIINPKPTTLPHKTNQGLLNTSCNLCLSVTKQTRTENSKVYVPEQITPFVSTAELMKKFQASTRDLSLPLAKTYQSQNQSRLMTLTKPKEPEFVTSQRIRPVRIKSTAELEEEMLAKIPKFKARPLNMKILATPALPAPQRSKPHPPEFQEFHLETMARASQHTETSSVVLTETSKHNDWRPHLTEPKSPLLQTTLRARPTKAKTSTEMEQEELQKMPKFKARSLNKKILESKGEMGIFCNTKKPITIAQEFNFATEERISRPNSVIDLFDKLSLNSESCREKSLQRNTTANPFLLRTEERGAEKVNKFVREVIHKQMEDERVRIPKANPYPYTTDYPVIPPKPEPKQCTKPEPFQLESLTRHEEERRKEMEERIRVEREEAQRRVFRAQPVIKEDPIPVPEKVRRPLTEIQEFNLHVDHRAVERADFNHKIKAKEMMYKRYREETEAAKMVEEERTVKQLRRTMVPQARPLPNFNNPFLPQKSNKETTKPKSPKLRVIRRIERRTLLASTNVR